MYRRTKEYVKSNNVEVDIFVQGQDYCNSELLYKLDRVTEFSDFTITKHEHRADLIAEDIYGGTAYTKYSWIIMYINRISIDDLVRGRVIQYIPLDKLTELINSI
jgi:hypothetical protein